MFNSESKSAELKTSRKRWFAEQMLRQRSTQSSTRNTLETRTGKHNQHRYIRRWVSQKMQRQNPESNAGSQHEIFGIQKRSIGLQEPPIHQPISDHTTTTTTLARNEPYTGEFCVPLLDCSCWESGLRNRRETRVFGGISTQVALAGGG